MCNAQVEWKNALNLCVAHPLKNHKSQNISFTYGLHLISYASKFKNVPCLIAAKSCVSEVKLCFRNSQIPYLKVNSIYKKFFVSSNFAATKSSKTYLQNSQAATMLLLAAAAKLHACCLFAAIHCEKPFISIRDIISSFFLFHGEQLDEIHSVV